MAASAMWASYFALQSISAAQVHHFVLSEFDYMTTGILPAFAPSKVYLSQNATWEIQSLQDYVVFLVEHDMVAEPGAAPFATAAFNLSSSDPQLLSSGFEDWLAFFSPAQAHAHALLALEPLAWGPLSFAVPTAEVSATASHVATTGVAPPTIWLTTIVPGAGRGQGTGGGGGGGGDGSAPDPAAASSARVMIPFALTGLETQSVISWFLGLPNKVVYKLC